MAEELRLAFILLGSLAIGAVILHGVWTVRKAVGEERKRKFVSEVEPQIEESELSEENQALKLQQMEMDFNELQAKGGATGLPVMNVDVDSIYHKNNDTPQYETPDVSAAVEGEHAESPAFKPQNELFQHVGKNSDQQVKFTSPNDDDDKDNEDDEFVRADLRHGEVGSDDLEPKLGNWSEVTDEPVQPKPVFKDISKVDEEEQATFSESPQAARTEPRYQSEPSFSAPQETQPQPEPAPEPPQEVLMLFVDKSEGAVIEGARLLPLLLTLGFKFGEMEFFHRHELNSGQGEILFSLANMFNPGTFDPDNMEQFSSRGLTIFMTLPNALEPLQTFNMMHNAAKKIAEEFGAKVLDEQRRPLDVSIVRGYVERIRKFKGKV